MKLWKAVWYNFDTRDDVKALQTQCCEALLMQRFLPTGYNMHVIIYISNIQNSILFLEIVVLISMFDEFNMGGVIPMYKLKCLWKH